MKTENKIILFFFFACLLYIWTQVAIAFGILKERQASTCVQPYQLSQWYTTIDLAKAVYTDVSQNYVDQMNECNNQVEHWKKQYYWSYQKLQSCESGYPNNPDDLDGTND